MPLDKSRTVDTLADIFKNKIIPLLQEYFYDDYEKIRLVLGDNKVKESNLQFVTAMSKKASDLFGKIDFEEGETDKHKVYHINDKAFKNINAYKHILKSKSEGTES